MFHKTALTQLISVLINGINSYLKIGFVNMELVKKEIIDSIGWIFYDNFYTNPYLKNLRIEVKNSLEQSYYSKEAIKTYIKKST